jgi:hypothetical protein
VSLQVKHSQLDAGGNIIPGSYTGELTRSVCVSVCAHARVCVCPPTPVTTNTLPRSEFLASLKAYSAGQQKNFVALDDTSEKYGHETFELLQEVVTRLVTFSPEHADVGKKLKNLARACHLHLKTNFRDHLSLSSKVGHHCLGFLFSEDVADHRCPHSCGNYHMTLTLTSLTTNHRHKYLLCLLLLFFFNSFVYCCCILFYGFVCCCCMCFIVVFIVVAFCFMIIPR